MFKKLGRALGGAGKGGSLRVKFDLEVVQVDNLPQAVRKCRVVWSRSAKVQMTSIKDVRGGVAQFKQTLTQVTSIHKDKNGDYESKEYVVKIQVPQGVAGDNIMTVGKATVNLARYVGDETNTQKDVLPVAVKVGHSTTGYVKFTITATHLGEGGDDGMTEVSGLTGLTSEGGGVPDQDLDGFDDPSPGRGKKNASPDAGSSRGKPSNKRLSALPTTQEEPESDSEDGSSRRKQSSKPKSGGGVDEIEPLRPAQSKSGRPGPDFGKKTQPVSGRPAAPARPTWDEDISSVESDLDEDDVPDARPVSKGVAKKSGKTSKKGLLGLMKRSADEDEEPEAPRSPPKPKEPEPDLQDLKSDLFGKKKDPSKARDKPSTSKGGAKASASEELEEDAARNALFSVPPKREKARKEAAPPEEEDEDALRGALFAVPKADKAAAASKSRKATPSPPPDEEDEDALRGALFAAAPAKSKPSKANKKPENYDDAEHEEQEPVFGKASRKGSAGRPKEEDMGDDDFYAKPGKKTAAAAAAAAAANADLLQELDMLRSQLQQAQLREEKLNLKVQELEDQLAEVVDPAEMYAQLQDQEDKHLRAMRKLEEESQFKIEELEMELEDLRKAGSKSGVADSARASEVAAREAEVAHMEEEAKTKLAEANRMVDESMLLAVKNQQEKRSLQEQVDKLRQQLEDRNEFSMAAAEAEEVISSLKDQLESLQAENDELKKSVDVQQGEVDALLDDIKGLLEESGTPMPSRLGPSPMSQLIPSVSLLCKLHQLKSLQVEELQAKVTEAEAVNSRMKLLELQARIDNLTDEVAALKQTNMECQDEATVLKQRNMKLQDELAMLKQSNLELQDEVSSLTTKLEVATAAAAATGVVAVSSRSPGGAGAASSHQLEDNSVNAARVLELETNNAALESQIQDLKYELKQSKTRSDINGQSLQAEVARLTAELAAAGALAATVSSIAADSKEMESLQSQLAKALQEKQELEVQLEELKEAEAVINEWEEYSSSLAAEKDQLRKELEEAKQQLEAANQESEATKLLLVELEQSTQSTIRDKSVAAEAAAAAGAAAAAAEINKLRDSSAEMSAEIEELTGKNAELTSTVAALRQQLGEVKLLQDQLDQLQAEAKASQDELQRERDALAEEAQGLRDALLTARTAMPIVASSSAARPWPSRHQHDDSDYDSEEDGMHTVNVSGTPGFDSMRESLEAQVSQLQEERDRLQAELAALQDKMAHRPLLDASSSADPDAHISSRGASNKQESATIEQLQDKVKLLTEWKTSAEASLGKLQVEQHVLTSDRDDALAAVAEADAKAAKLQAQLDAARSESAAVEGETITNLQAQIQQLQGQLQASSAANVPDTSVDLELSQLRGQVETASAMVFVARRALSNCVRVVSSRDPPYVAEDVELDVALVHLKDEALGLLNELQSQARQAPRFQAQIAAASQRVVELEEQIRELEGEIRVLTAGGAGVTAGAAMAARRTSYADDDNLALSAMEQQMALTGGKMQEQQASLETLTSENARLAGEVSRLQAELKAAGGKAGVVRGTAVGATAASRRKSALSTSQDSDDDDVPSSTSLAASRAQKRELERAQNEVVELRAKCEKLEAVCEDLEASTAAERDDLMHQLDAAHAEIASLRAGAGARKAEDVLAESESGDLRLKLTDLEQRAAHVARDNTRLAGLLEDERAAREHLEDMVKRGLSDMGDDEAVEAVEAFEVKYARLKERYKQLEAAAGDEADDLAAQLADAQAELEQLRRARPNGTGVQGARGVGGANSTEITSLKEENERLVGQLVSKQMEFAMLSEEQAMLKRDLYRAKEVNMKLAAKMTKLEAQAYSGRQRSKENVEEED